MGGFHMGFGGSPSAAGAVLDSIRAAAEQNIALQQKQQQQAQMGLKDQFETELKMRKEGYTPYMQTTGQEASGLKTRDANPAANATNVITDHFGRKWVAPPAKPEATPQQTQTDLASALEHGYQQPDAGGNISRYPTTPRAIQTGDTDPATGQVTAFGPAKETGMFGTHEAVPPEWQQRQIPGGPAVYKPDAAEQQYNTVRAETGKAARTEEDKTYGLPNAITSRWEQKAGLPAGTLKGMKVPTSQVREVISGLSDPKQGLPHISKEGNDEGDITTVARDPQTGKELWRTVDKGIGAKHRDPEAPAAGSTTAGDIKDVVQMIHDGQATPDLTKYSFRDRTAIAAGLKRMGYNQALAQQDWTATQKHLATMNGAQQERLRQAISFTSDSLDNIEKLYDEWQKYGAAGGIKAFNRASMAAAKHMPGKAGEIATVLEAQINDLTSELGTVYKGGNSSTDESLKLASGNLKGEWNDQTFKRAVGQIRQNLKIRKNSVMSSQAVGVREGSPYTPQATQQAPAAQGGAGGGQSGGYIQGHAYGGMIFLGGDPNSQASWKKK